MWFRQGVRPSQRTERGWLFTDLSTLKNEGWSSGRRERHLCKLSRGMASGKGGRTPKVVKARSGLKSGWQKSRCESWALGRAFMSLSTGRSSLLFFLLNYNTAGKKARGEGGAIRACKFFWTMGTRTLCSILVVLCTSVIISKGVQRKPKLTNECVRWVKRKSRTKKFQFRRTKIFFFVNYDW